MQPLAAWLISRPQNAILGLAATYILFLPLAGIFSGAVMVLLVLHHGVRRAMMQALIAAAVLALIGLLTGGSAPAMALAALLSWLPAFVLAALLGNWRSLTLTLQVSVIVALAGLLGFYAVLGDPAVFWSSWLADEAATMFREMGLHEQATALLENQAAIAQQMTVLFVFTIWSLYAFGLLLGYALYQAALGQKSVFGRFCDLNFGRVLALIMASVPTNEARFALPDLASRLASGPTWKLQAMDDDDLLHALQLRSHWRGLELPDETGQYLMRRVERTAEAVFRVLDQLDQAALIQQRRLTVPFVKEVLQQEP